MKKLLLIVVLALSCVAAHATTKAATDEGADADSVLSLAIGAAQQACSTGYVRDDKAETISATVVPFVDHRGIEEYVATVVVRCSKAEVAK